MLTHPLWKQRAGFLAAEPAAEQMAVPADQRVNFLRHKNDTRKPEKESVTFVSALVPDMLKKWIPSSSADGRR